MGWMGYGIYDGDETQTRHYDFIKWSKCGKEDEVYDDWFRYRKTVIPKERIPILEKNLELVIEKMPNVKFWNEDKAIAWQMLLALLLDNKIKPPVIVKKNGILGTEFLMEEHASDFNEPHVRRKVLRNFIKRTKSL
jgi:hypothetical protein